MVMAVKKELKKSAGGKQQQSWGKQQQSWGKGQQSWGKGWGKGASKGSKGSSGPKGSKKDFEVDTESRHQGKVEHYKKFGGFGFITPSQSGLVPGDKVFVFWKSIESDDRHPSLVQDMDVEFSCHKFFDKATQTYQVRAKMVTLPGGGNIAVQDDLDAEKKTFVGGQHTRYTGMLKFYDAAQGFGYIKMDEGYALDEDVGKEVRVERAEVNAGGRQPINMKETQVEFGIWKTKKDAYKAYNMTLPGTVPITQGALENRKMHGNRAFQGTVELYNWRQGWGFIKVNAGINLPANINKKIAEMRQASEEKGKTVSDATDKILYFRKDDIQKGVRLEKDQAVSFQVYTDDKGAGACEIH